jgi:cullin-4
MSARFDSGKYEIGLSLFQAVVLLHFNTETNLDFSDIQGRTGIGESAKFSVTTLENPF